jgi:hypothetical protein
MDTSEFQRQSYLLRLWCTGEGNTWRAMLERVGSHEHYGFADLESLFAFLCAQTDRTGQLRNPQEKPGEQIPVTTKCERP